MIGADQGTQCIRSKPMRYVILAVAAVLAAVGWLNSADGRRTKQHLMEPRDAQNWFVTEG
jgi:hypothetical protein